METRANYLLVGSFVLLMLAGLAGFVIWLAKFQFETAFDRFDVRFAGTVTGLAEGGPVRFRGVRVGEVTAIGIDAEDPGMVTVTIEVAAATPEQVIAGQWKVNDVVQGTNLPKVPDEMIHNIIYENWKGFLPEYA